MMIKKTSLIFFTVLFFSTNIFAAGSSDSDSGNNGGSSKIKSNYDKAVTLIKSAKKYEKKDKVEKANKKYKKALSLLIKSNKKVPNKADTLNYLGFTTRKLGDYAGGEKYYLQGLAIEPRHNGINEYLGELYVATNRINLAKERLKVLENCNCEEYNELKEIIAGTKVSKY
jgi:tetratricopeptide (TPR) repeat protein